MDTYIPEEWLQAASVGDFLYPCAGHDYRPAIDVFLPYVSDFTFCDLYYPAGLEMRPVLESQDLIRISSQTEGATHSTLRTVGDHPRIESSTLIETYRHQPTNREITIRRRRGFGQFALLDAPLRSISVFMHRGDSPGEGGSNIYYLADCPSKYAPIGHLLTTLSERLTDRAIVLSDGSNTRIKPLKALHNQNISGAEALERMSGSAFIQSSFRWRCIGFLNNKYGPTLAWGLERIDQ